MTTGRRRGTRCISPRCSADSSRICAVSSVTASSTLPPSNLSSDLLRTSTSRSAAPCPAPNCGRSSQPTCHQVWRPPPASAVQHDETRTCRSVTRRPAATSTRRAGSSCRPGTPRPAPSATETNRCAWAGSGHGSTRRASRGSRDVARTRLARPLSIAGTRRMHGRPADPGPGTDSPWQQPGADATQYFSRSS
jgi:hypothetical protein